MKKRISHIVTSSFYIVSATFSYCQAAHISPISMEQQSSLHNDWMTLSQGKKFLSQSRWNEALDTFRELLKTEPDSPEILAGVSKALAYLGRRNEGLHLLNHSIRHQKGLGRAFLIRRVRTLSRVFTLNKTFQLYQDGLNFMAAKKYRNAREKFGLALIDEPDNVEILTRLGQSLILDGDSYKAAGILRTATGLNDFEPQIHLWLGRALFQIKQMKEAVLFLSSAHKDLPESELASVWLADALAATGQENAAIRLLDRDIQVSPLHVMSLVKVSRLRFVGAHSDPHTLGIAKRDLQLATSRLEKYRDSGLMQTRDELSLDLGPNATEAQEEIKRLQQQAVPVFSQAHD
jgi:tetratricopeptide (TPR) repeat protein